MSNVMRRRSVSSRDVRRERRASGGSIVRVKLRSPATATPPVLLAATSRFSVGLRSPAAAAWRKCPKNPSDLRDAVAGDRSHTNSRPARGAFDACSGARGRPSGLVRLSRVQRCPSLAQRSHAVGGNVAGSKAHFTLILWHLSHAGDRYGKCAPWDLVEFMKGKGTIDRHRGLRWSERWYSVGGTGMGAGVCP